MTPKTKRAIDVVAETGLPLRLIKEMLKMPNLRPDDLISESAIGLHMDRELNHRKMDTLSNADRKKKIGQREKEKNKAPNQINPYAPKGATRFSKTIVISMPMGGKLK